MKLNEILNLLENRDWKVLLSETINELTDLLGDVKFNGGYCFHLALALMLKVDDKDIIIITDNGHAAVYDQKNDISIDSSGIHKGESALNERTVKIFINPNNFIKSVSKGWTSSKQIEDLKKVKEHFKKTA